MDRKPRFDSSSLKTLDSDFKSTMNDWKYLSSVWLEILDSSSRSLLITLSDWSFMAFSSVTKVLSECSRNLIGSFSCSMISQSREASRVLSLSFRNCSVN
ncbi:hypothetical protein OGATHE_000699 [Ogataea polymorpha]|uniref:Uncharacterized protein n=1 Tax=Ogataea polymorpha TaxID=460523 RepID=A0A9P8PVI8_9ASCO|nr:hypothetical protein OGATHE_000699 [Ogataea polymorpha]